MTPVRVKLYGLVPMTRRRYLAQLVVALVLAGVLLLGWWLYWPRVRAKLMPADSPMLERLVVFWNVAPAVVLSILVLQGIEAWFVLRLFARKEAAARAEVPPPPGSTH